MGGLVGILYTIAVILIIVWIIGLVVHVTFWAIHLLVVIAVILILWNLIAGRRAV
jgi:uncharacterized membrane protein YfbV (UPF0208 family)